MKYPDFFDDVPRISLHDPLAEFLGAAENGMIEYSYLDAVKLAGHSCPTVASAYWMTRLALGALYGSQTPKRGAIRVDFRENSLNGVTGVIANVVSMLTGATHDTGFKGIVGRFDRRHLMFFDAAVPLEIRFTRTDTGDKVDVAANLQVVASDPDVPTLIRRCSSDTASAEELRRFAALWQERVRRILIEHREDSRVFVVSHV